MATGRGWHAGGGDGVSKVVTLKIRRQDGPSAVSTFRWELHAAAPEAVTVADALDAIAGLAYDNRCTWPRCGVCTMVIEGVARPACGTRLQDVVNRRGTVTLEPLSGFVLRRDLWVDRTRLAEEAARFAPWPEIASASVSTVALMEPFDRCTRCGACLDACPEVSTTRAFVGAASFGLSHAGRMVHPDERRRLDPLLAEGGIAECGGAQACVAVCPEEIPLDEALTRASAAATRHGLGALLGRWRDSDDDRSPSSER